MTGPYDTDELLMEQVRVGDRGPIGVLVTRWGEPLLTYLVRMLGDQQQAERLFQEVFLALWTHRRGYQYPRPFRHWLFEIASKKCLYELRKVRQRSTDREGAAPEPSPAAPLEPLALAARALTRLPTRERTVLVLRLYLGFSYAEIAHITGRHETLVRMQMNEALTWVRRYWRLRGGNGA